MPPSTSNRENDSTNRRGPIIVARHGRPALDRTAKPRLTWRGYVDWWARYEIGSLAADQAPPQNLIDIVADADLVFASGRPRAQETAHWAAPHLTATHMGLFNEAHLPPPCIPGVKFLPKTWNVLARSAWTFGHALGEEPRSAANIRCQEAAEYLVKASENGKVFLAAHGWFNRMLHTRLKRLGLRCTHNGGDSYWSYRVYEWCD